MGGAMGGGLELAGRGGGAWLAGAGLGVVLLLAACGVKFGGGGLAGGWALAWGCTGWNTESQIRTRGEDNMVTAL